MASTEKNMEKYGVAWFTFDEDSAVDSKGSNVITAASGVTVISGVKGNARSFNGTSSYINLPTTLIPIGAKSIRLKIRIPSTPSSTGYILINTNAYALYQSFGIQVDVNGFLTVVGGNATSSRRYLLDTGRNICDNQWHDILFTWDGTTNSNTVKLYVDDMRNPVATTTALSQETVAYNDTKTAIGRLGGNGTTGYAKFDLDELEIYNAAINPVESSILLSSNDEIYSFERNDYYSALIPTMQGIDSEVGSVIGSTSYSTNYTWKAFDNDNSSPYQTNFVVSTSNPVYIGFRFKEPTSVTRYSFIAGLINFRFMASNDGITWDLIDTKNGIPSNTTTTQTYNVYNDEFYTYYKIESTLATSGRDWINIFSVQFFETKSIYKLLTLPNQSEQTFITYGMESPIHIKQIKEVKSIKSSSTTDHSGKTFTHTIDLSKRRVDKIILS